MSSDSKIFHSFTSSIKQIANNKEDVIVVTMSAFLCLIGIGDYPIYILDEAKNAEAAREMLRNGNYVVPTFNDIIRTDKPPLHYYFMIIGYKLFGVNAFGARFFSGIFGVLTLWGSFYFVRRFVDKISAWVFIVVLWSSIFFIQEFHLAVPDPYLIFFISIGLWFFYTFYTTKTKKHLWFMYVAFALGTLTKGPIAVALPGLICLLFLITTKSLTIKNILSFQPVMGILIFTTIAFPWYLWVHIETGGAWTRGFFLDHNLNRFGNKMEGHGGIFFITWVFVLLGLMPFSFFCIQAFTRVFAERTSNSVLWFSGIVSLVFIIFFSISGTKLPNYTMPCYPFLALIIANGLMRFYREERKKWDITLVVMLIMLLAIALPIVGKFALQQEKELLPVSDVAFWLLPTSLIIVLGAVFYVRSKYKQSFVTISLGWMILIPMLFLVIYPKLTQQSPVEKARMIIKQDHKIAAYQRFDPAFPVNFKKTFEVYTTKEEVASFFNKFPNGYLITNDRNVNTLTENKELIMIFEGKALFESHITRIFRKK